MAWLSLENNLSPESGNADWLFETCLSHAFKVLLDSVTETVEQVGQRCAPHEVVLAVLRIGYVPGRSILSLKIYDKQKNITQNISVSKSSENWDFFKQWIWGQLGYKNSFVGKCIKHKGHSIAIKAEVLFLFSYKGQADLSEREYAFLQYIACTRPLDGNDKEQGFVCLE